METKEFLVATPADFLPVIDQVLMTPQFGSGAQLVCLVGDLGAGKTTFTQQLAAQLGVMEPVVSPTFGIMKLYNLVDHPGYDQLVHIDAYRIEDISEVGPLRLQEVLNTPRTLVCLEWPENIAEMLPEEKIEVVIEIGEGEVRIVTVR